MLPGKPRDRRGGAVAWDHLGEKHLATDAPDEFGSDDLVDSVIGALDEKLRPDCLDEIDRRVLLEYDNQIDCRQRRQHLGPRRLGLSGTARTFQPCRRRIAIETDNQPIASCLGLSEQCDMSRVQQVETTVREADLEPLTAPP